MKYITTGASVLMEKYKIREMKISDAEKLYLFYQDKELSEFFHPYGKIVTLKQIMNTSISRMKDNNEFAIIIYDKDSNIYGHSFLKKTPNIEATYGFGIGISQKVRGMGLSKAMMNQLFELGHKKGVKKITLSVYEANKKAYGLYLKYGFREVERILTNGMPNIRMEKLYDNNNT